MEVIDRKKEKNDGKERVGEREEDGQKKRDRRKEKGQERKRGRKKRGRRKNKLTRQGGGRWVERKDKKRQSVTEVERRTEFKNCERNIVNKDKQAQERKFYRQIHGHNSGEKTQSYRQGSSERDRGKKKKER